MNDLTNGAVAVEMRVAPQNFELRQAQDDEPVRVVGYAAVFNSPTDIAGIFMEQIAPGAFDDVLSNDVRFLINHEGLPLARSSAGNLRLSVDAKGLMIEADLDGSDPDVQRIVSKMRNGNLREMSFAFRADKEEWDETGDVPIRTIQHLSELRDVSIVTNPAYPDTEIGLRSLEASRALAGGTMNSQGQTESRMRMRLALAAADGAGGAA